MPPPKRPVPLSKLSWWMSEPNGLPPRSTPPMLLSSIGNPVAGFTTDMPSMALEALD